MRHNTTTVRNIEGTNTDKVDTIVKGLRRFNEEDKHIFGAGKVRVKAHLNMPAPAIYGILAGHEKPNPKDASSLVKWKGSKISFYSTLALATDVTRARDRKKSSEADNRLRMHHTVSNVTRPELIEELANIMKKKGRDPDDFLHIMETERCYLPRYRGVRFFSLNDSRRLDCLSRPSTAEKPSGGR